MIAFPHKGALLCALNKLGLSRIAAAVGIEGNSRHQAACSAWVIRGGCFESFRNELMMALCSCAAEPLVPESFPSHLAEISPASVQCS